MFGLLLHAVHQPLGDLLLCERMSLLPVSFAGISRPPVLVDHHGGMHDRDDPSQFGSERSVMCSGADRGEEGVGGHSRFRYSSQCMILPCLL